MQLLGLPPIDSESPQRLPIAGNGENDAMPGPCKDSRATCYWRSPDQSIGLQRPSRATVTSVQCYQPAGASAKDDLPTRHGARGSYPVRARPPSTSARLLVKSKYTFLRRQNANDPLDGLDIDRARGRQFRGPENPPVIYGNG